MNDFQALPAGSDDLTNTTAKTPTEAIATGYATTQLVRACIMLSSTAAAPNYRFIVLTTFKYIAKST